jgi:hypothetical protein
MSLGHICLIQFLSQIPSRIWILAFLKLNLYLNPTGWLWPLPKVLSHLRLSAILVQYSRGLGGWGESCGLQ